MYIPKEMMIELDKNQNNVLNKSKILAFIETVKKVDLLEAYVNAISLVINTNPNLNIDDVKEIIEFTNNKINNLKGTKNLSEIFVEVKQTTNNLNNITIIDSPAEMNAKNKEGFRHDVTYIKININGKNELYEITNVEKVISFLRNKEIVTNLSENEIIIFLRENSKQIETTEIEKTQEKELNSETIREEINNIYDPYLKNMFIEHQNIILQERLKIDEYIKKNMPDAKVEYGMNSYGERIYMVNDKIIKFVDNNMQILAETESEELNKSSFYNYQSGNNDEIDFLDNRSTNIYDYDGKENLLNTIIDAIFYDYGVTNEQIEFLTDFLNACVINEEQGLNNPGNLQEIFDKYYEYATVENKFLNEKIKSIFKRKEELEKSKTQDNSLELEKTNVLKLTPPTDLNSKAFITTAIILESTLVIVFVISLVMLLK